MPKQGKTRSASADHPLAVVNRPLADIRLDPKNSRVHSQKQVEQIARSIDTFGFNVPVLVDAQNRLIAGHGRVLAAKTLGINRLPTIQLDHLSEPQIRAFQIADNRLTENSEWDAHLLGEQLKALSEVELDFNLDVIGFEVAEIDSIIEGLSPVTESEPDPADVIADAGAAVTQVGDLWLLGRHRVLCGNSLDDRDYEQLMQDRRASAVFTDPPYNDPIDGYVAGFGKSHHREFAMASGEMSEKEFIEFLFQSFRNLGRHSETGVLHFICLDWRHLPEFLAASRGVYSEIKNLCAWVKESGGQGSLYRSRHELVLVFKNGKSKHRNNIQLGQYGRYRTNVWEYPRVRMGEKSCTDERPCGSHPTIKPVAMVADAILDCTARNDLVLDSFLGSGTTVIAAEQTGRICYGLELDPSYIDAIVRRWQMFTTKTAVHEQSGKSFAQMESEARNGQ